MGRLFWKFFLTFWLAVSAAGLLVGILVWLYKSTEHQADNAIEVGPPPALVVRIGESVLTSAGVEALRVMMRDLQTREPFPLYAVDADGNELLGRPVNAAAIAAAERFANSGEPHRPSRQIRLAQGDAYLLFVPARHPQFGIEAGGGQRSGHPGPPPPADRPSPWLPIFVGVLASIVFSALLAWYMVKPVRYLRQAFNAASVGDLETRVQPLMGSRRDEIADLGREYDRMAGRIKALIDAQRHLFHDVSHELRSPLARLHAAIGLARQDPQQMKSTLDRIEREANKLDELVGELLMLARLESGIPPSREHEIELFALVDGIIEDARFEADAKDVIVDFIGEGQAVTRTQGDLLGQAIENIIRNAIKYTPAQSTVTVRAELEHETNTFTLSVSDQGPGVEEGELQSILEPFFRGRGGAHREGYGLGLAIARRAIETHGGTIRVSNLPEGGLRVEINIKIYK